MKKLFIYVFTIILFFSCTKNFKHIVSETNKSLDDFSGSFVPQIISYDGNKATSVYPFIDNDLQIDGSTKWAIDIQRTATTDNTSAIDYELTFRLEQGAMQSVGTAVEFTFNNWNTDNYLFAPAAMYNGNRYRVHEAKYPPYIYNEADRPMNMPITITNVPHLNLDGSDARIDMLTSNCSTPLIGFYDKTAKRGFFLQTVQDTILGNGSFTVKEYPSQKKLSIILAAPGVREHKYEMCSNTVESDDKAVDMQQGNEIKMKFRLYNFKAANLSAYFDRFLSIRKALSGQNTFLNREPFSSYVPVILDHHDRTKWYEDSKYGYICNIPDGDSPFWHFQLGWNGAPVFALAQQFRSPTPERTRRMSRNFDTIELMQGESGLFYGMFRRGQLLGDNFGDMEKQPEIAMIRRTGITIYFGLQLFDLLKSRGESDIIKPSWENMLHKAADALVTLWDKYGQFGQHVNVRTGEITTNNSSAGVINIAALAYASKYFNDPKYMQIAEQAADFYYKRDLQNGYLGGAPAEILQCPDSEASAEFTESLVTLFEMTRNEKWLRMAQDAAAYFSTWVVAYDFSFPENSIMRRINAKAAGSVWASIQNEHSAPGIYVMSGDFLLKLYRATGDERYLQLGRDIAHNVVQYITTEENPVVPEADYGSVSERVNLSDWEGKDNVGNAIGAGDSNMAWENVALFSIIQNPGIYLQTDTKKLFVYDHVNAALVSDENNKMTLKIENPTKHDAEVALFIETSEEAKTNSLGWNAFDKWKKVFVPKGETIEVKIN